MLMQQWLKIAGMSRMGFAVVGLPFGGDFHFGAETILAAVILLILILGFFWRKLGSHPAYGMGLLSLCTAAILADAWSRKGIGDSGTLLRGAVFVLVLIRFISKMRVGVQDPEETEHTSASAAISVVPPVLLASEKKAGNLPMMPIRDMVVVPGMKTPFLVGRKASIQALEYAMANDQKLFLATQQDAAAEDPKVTEIGQFGCICKVLQNLKMADGNFKILVEGVEMAKAIAVDDSRGFLFATLQNLDIKSETI
jgi:hypothetical protein